MTSYCIIIFCRFPTPLWPPPHHVLILWTVWFPTRFSTLFAASRWRIWFLYVSIYHDTCILIIVWGCRPPYSASPPLFPPCLPHILSLTHAYRCITDLSAVCCTFARLILRLGITSRVLRVLTSPPLFTTFEAPCGNLCALCGLVGMVGRIWSICTTWRLLSVCNLTFQTRFCEKVGDVRAFLTGFRKIVLVHLLKIARVCVDTAAGYRSLHYCGAASPWAALRHRS